MTTFERLRIEHERDYDTLTGLYNRQAFQRESESLFSEPKQLKHAALLMLDMDNLKYTNDTYGHDWGDQYIRQAGRCFADYTPKDTLCARISGDEFHLLFYGYESQDEIRKVLTKLREQLHQQSLPLPDGKVLHLSISGGIAWYPEDGTQLDILKNMQTLPCIRSSIPAKVHSVNLTLAATIRKPTPRRPVWTCTD
ncbi:MAG: GGDEF domain-containing protein [Lachnospiraceae bacterium]